MTEKDPLKEMFQALPELAALPGLKMRILEEIRGDRTENQIWILKPALALASFLIVSLLGVSLSLSFLRDKEQKKEDSPVLRWARADSVLSQKGGRIL